MRRTPPPVVEITIDRRTDLDRVKEELTESLRLHGDATTIAAVIRFIDQMRDVTDRVLSVGADGGQPRHDLRAVCGGATGVAARVASAEFGGGGAGFDGRAGPAWCPIPGPMGTLDVGASPECPN
jgi:hypothetical protein